MMTLIRALWARIAEVVLHRLVAERYVDQLHREDVGVAGHGRVRLEIYDVLGRRVAVPVDNDLAPGRYTASWDGTGANGRPLATGVYFYRLHAGGEVFTRKLLLLK